MTQGSLAPGNPGSRPREVAEPNDPSRPGHTGGTDAGMRALELVRRARVWLSRAVEPGSGAVYRYVADLGPIEAVRRIRAGTAPPDVDRAVAGRREIDQAETDLATAERHGIRVLIPEDDDWPSYVLLRMEAATARDAADLAPPLMLWVRGDARLDKLVERAVAIVGTRAPSGYGEQVARTLAYQLAIRDWTVVSGGALGIDTIVHRTAVHAGAPTVAVIAGGVDSPYPDRNHRLFEEVTRSGLLVSEWPPGTVPQRHRFLIRNRLIAGLVAGTVVVEAGARSGTSNTARRTRELGGSVMAIPGPITSGMSVGCHQLVRSGDARLVTSVEEVLEEIGRLGEDLAQPPRAQATLVDRLDPLCRRVLDGLPARSSVRAEEIASAAGVEVLVVLRCLPALEVLGLVRHDRGSWALTRIPPRSTSGPGQAPEGP
jgi:DNA processing protein